MVSKLSVGSRNAMTEEQRAALDKKRARVATIVVAGLVSGLVSVLDWKYGRR